MNLNKSQKSLNVSKQERGTTSPGQKTTKKSVVSGPSPVGEKKSIVSNISPKTARSDMGSEKMAEPEEFDDTPMDVLILWRDDRDLYKYEWGNYTPEAVRGFFQRSGVLLAILCLIDFAFGFGARGAFDAAAVEIQKEFRLSQFDFILILIMHYVGIIVALLPIAYYGTHSAHKARWITVSALLVALGGFVNSVPRMVITVAEGKVGRDYEDMPRYHSYENGTTVDALNRTASFCRDTTLARASLNRMKYVFGVGNFLYGLGRPATYTMGIVLMDEHVSHQESSLYTGIFYFSEILGPVAGYLLSGASRQIHDYVYHLEEPTNAAGSLHEPDHDTGTWWFPIFMGSLLALLDALLMSGFPRQLAGETRAYMREMMEEVIEGWRVPESAGKDWIKDVGEGPWDMIKRTRLLILQPLYLCLLVIEIGTNLVITGFARYITFSVVHAGHHRRLRHRNAVHGRRRWWRHGRHVSAIQVLLLDQGEPVAVDGRSDGRLAVLVHLHVAGVQWISSGSPVTTVCCNRMKRYR